MVKLENVTLYRSIIAMSQVPDSKTLQEEWSELSTMLFQEDGTNSKFPYDIRNNQGLSETLRAVSMLYLPKCEEKFVLLHQKRQLEKQLLGDTEDVNCNEIMKKLDDIQAAIKKFDAELVLTNVEARRTIMQSEGFKTLIDKMGDKADRPSKIATAILSPVVQYAVAAACSHSGYIVDINDDPRLITVTRTIVPRSFGDGVGA